MKDNNKTSSNTQKVKKRSMMAEIWRNFKKNKGAMIGLAIVFLIFVASFSAQLIYDYEEDIIKTNIMERLQHPSKEHWFGTDQFGRDIFARLLYGARYSLLVGLLSVFVSTIVGCTLGLIAGYYGGVIENIILRSCEIFGGIPTILLGIALVSAFGQSIMMLIIAIGLVNVPLFSRTARAAVLSVRNQEFIEAAKACGVSDFKIIFSHILPNCVSMLTVRCTMSVAGGILSASSLSFLGLGVPQPAPEWGAMLSSGRDFIRDYSYMTFFPGLAIMITILAINLVGDGLRDAMDPKLKR